MGWGKTIVALLGLALLAGCGVYRPDIGDSPFLCAPPGEEEQCPHEYHCVDGICRPHDWVAPDAGVDGAADATADDAELDDASTGIDSAADVSAQDGAG